VLNNENELTVIWNPCTNQISTCVTYSFPHYLHLNSDVDDVHEMMDDIQEQTELADEISRAISEPAGFGMDVDEVRNLFALFHLN